MRWKHKEFDSTADECVAKSNEQKARNYSANSAAKCMKHWKRNQLKANNEKDANLADEAEFTIMNFIKKQIDKEIKEQWLRAWNDSIKKENQYQKHTARMNLSYKSLKKLWKIDRLTFSTFIQLKMKHDYFKSYLHRLSKNNSNKCYEICKARQTLKHLLLNCKHYRAEQLQLKAKAQFKIMNTILMLFIIKIERIAMLKYLKSTWIATRKWLLRTKE